MTKELAIKRQAVDLQHARLSSDLARTRSRLAHAASSPPALFSAFTAGFVFQRLLRRQSGKSSREPGEQATVSPRARQISVLLGALLGAAIKRSLFGLIKDISQSGDIAR